MAYWRDRTKETPVVRYTCNNCSNEFEYMTFAKRDIPLHFCSKACKVEYHYLKAYMSNAQLDILECLIKLEGHAKLYNSRSIDSLRYRIVPLIEVVYEFNKQEVYARITQRGRWWYKVKRGVGV